MNVVSDSVDRYSGVASEMERLLVGALLVDAGKCYDAMQLVSGSDFTDSDLGRLYDLLCSLVSMGKPVSDTKWLVSELQGSAVLKTIGVAAVAEMIATVPHAGHATYYAEQVLKYSTRRRYRQVAFRMLEDIDDDKMDNADIGNRATKGIAEAQEQSFEKDTFTALECADAALARIEAGFSSSNSKGIATGIFCIDQIAGYMLPGELIVLAARTSVGKTTLAMDIAINAANCKPARRSLIVSCEMDQTSLGDRFLSRFSGVSTELIQSQPNDTGIKRKLQEARRAIDVLAFDVWVPKKATVHAIGSKARSHAAKHGLDLLVVDHLGLLNASAKPKNRYEAIGEITRELKQLAISLSVPILLLCQLNRTGEGEIPTLAMLRDSGSIEEDADKVWLLHRDRKATDAVLRIAKFRNGSIGDTPPGALQFNPDRCSFGDAYSDFTTAGVA